MSTAQTTTQNKDDAKKFENLLGPMDPKLDREVREMLVTARVGLLLRASFFGNLATRLKLVNADEWCPTAATDGRHFYYNSRFIKLLKPKEIEFLFGHEVLHCVYDHFGRRGDRDPQLFNIASQELKRPPKGAESHRRKKWEKSLALTWAPPTRAWPSWKATTPR